MDDDAGPVGPAEGDGDGGTAAVLYAMFTSFTEALDGLENRLAALEAAVRRVADASPAGPPDTDVGDLVKAQSEAVDRRLAGLESSVDALRVLLQGHIDDTAHSLGRRAGEAGRRLVSDLGLKARSRRPPGP